MALSDRRQGSKNGRDERLHIFKFIRFRRQHDQTYGQSPQVLLKNDVVVDGDKCLELPCHKRQQFTITLSGPTHLLNSL